MQTRKPKILLIDIETSPIVSYVWGLFNQFPSVDMVKDEWTILSFCAKWLGAKGVIYHDTWEAKGGRNDDRNLVKIIWRLLDEADIVIAHNGKRFDVKKINSRCMQLGMKPYSPIKVIDTLLEHRAVAAHTSNKLQWLADKFSPIKKRNHGKFPGFDLHKEYLNGNPEAREEMRLYNIDDVRSMEYVYLELRPWIAGHPNLALYINPEDMKEGDHVCPNCGSLDTKYNKPYLAKTNWYEGYLCRSCGAHFRGRKANPGQKASQRTFIMTN